MESTNLRAAAYIETPCPTSWDKMEGTSKVRFCNLCSLNVYNIADMTDSEAEATLSAGVAAGKICAVLYRRPDGTITTDNCPRSLRKIRDASRWLKMKIVAATALLLAVFSPAQAQYQKSNSSADSSKKIEKPASPQSQPPADLPVPGGISFRWTDDTIYKEEIVHRILQTWMDANSNPPIPVVKFKINIKGAVSELQIVKSSGSSDIDRAALKAIVKKSPFAAPPAGARLPVEIEVRLSPAHKEK